MACGRLQPFEGGDLLYSASGPVGGAAEESPGVGHHITELLKLGLQGGGAGCSLACGRWRPYAGGDSLYSCPVGGVAGESPGVGQGRGTPHHTA